MKKSNLLKALCFAVLPVASQGFSADAIPASASTFSLTLTLTTTTPSAVKKDPATGKPIKGEAPVASTTYAILNAKTGATVTTTEAASKIVTTKYTVKEFLTDLTDEETPLITDIKGWSIQKIQSTSIDAESGLPVIGAPTFFLVKKGAAPIALGNKISSDSILAKKAAVSKIVTSSTTTTGADPVTTVTPVSRAYSEAQKFAGDLTLAVNGKTFELAGIYTGSEKLGLNKAKAEVILSGAGKFTSLSGFLSEVAILEGSAALTPGVATDVSAYPGFVVTPPPVVDP